MEAVIAQQFSLKAGLKKFGDEGKKAVMEKLKQLHYKILSYLSILVN